MAWKSHARQLKIGEVIEHLAAKPVPPLLSNTQLMMEWRMVKWALTYLTYSFRFDKNDTNQLDRFSIKSIERTKNARSKINPKIQVVTKLKSELKDSTHEHIELETKLRHENNRLETEIQDMIEHYDAEMFRRHRDIENISAEYALEKDELAIATEELQEVLVYAKD